MKSISYISMLVLLCIACGSPSNENSSTINEGTPEVDVQPGVVIIEAESLLNDNQVTIEDGLVKVKQATELEYEVMIPVAGRYKVEIIASSDSVNSLWLEDYYTNADGRTYNITGSLDIPAGEGLNSYSVDGTPLNANAHPLTLHVTQGGASIDKMILTLIKEHRQTPASFTQNTSGENWEIVWSDEFDGTSIDTSKWTFDIGNWGWGNNELQYYTENRSENARIEEGTLVIEARKNDLGQPWTSARLTTRGKASFLYGRIEFMAKVPRGKGNWAAGWTLGDSYIDELSWPYCGEIDILESVGYEVDDTSGDGIAHCTVHTPAYYFKINNQISSTIDVENIAGEYHLYAVEWTPTEIRGFVDDTEYYVYDKNANELEWPFDKPQNIILNLAMGGGWGGAQGMDTTITSQEFILDYVRVYEKK